MAAQQPSRSSTHTYPNKIEKKDEKKSCLRRHHILQTFSTKFTYIQASFSELAQSALNQSLMLCFFLSGRSSVISGVIHPGFIFCVIFFGPDNLAIRCSNVPFLSFFLSFFFFFFWLSLELFFVCVNALLVTPFLLFSDSFFRVVLKFSHVQGFINNL